MKRFSIGVTLESHVYVTAPNRRAARKKAEALLGRNLLFGDRYDFSTSEDGVRLSAAAHVEKVSRSTFKAD